MAHDIEVEAETLEEARRQVEARVPKGSQVISEKVVSSGELRTCEVTGDTIEDASANARNMIPRDATILELKEISASKKQTITIQAFDERGIESDAKRQLGDTALVKRLRRTATGKKGFLGIGKTPNRYEAEVVQPAVVAITYKPKAKITVIIGLRVVRKFCVRLRDYVDLSEVHGRLACTTNGMDQRCSEAWCKYTMYGNIPMVDERNFIDHCI